MKTDSLGDRMKAYEAASDLRLPARLPVLLRLDGNSFSRLTATKKFEKPFDKTFNDAMNYAAEAVVRYTHGCFAYVQSDEITVLLRNDRSHSDEPFLGNRVQKICSLAAATCSVAFVNALQHRGLMHQFDAAAFDCRIFVIPPSDVTNAFLWRQHDAWKNCVGAVAWYGLKAKYGSKKAQDMLLRKSTKERQEMIFSELGLNMNDYPEEHKRGRIIVRNTEEVPLSQCVPPEVFERLTTGDGPRNPWDKVTRTRFVSEAAPDFHKEGRWFVQGMLAEMLPEKR